LYFQEMERFFFCTIIIDACHVMVLQLIFWLENRVDGGGVGIRPSTTSSQGAEFLHDPFKPEGKLA